MQELVRQEAELRRITLGRFVACSLNLLAHGFGTRGNSLSLRDNLGSDEEVDLMCDKYMPTPLSAEDPYRLTISTGPDLALDFMSLGWRKSVSTEEILGRSILMGLDMSAAERTGKTLILTTESLRIPIEMIV